MRGAMRNARGNDPAAERLICAIYNVSTIEEAAEARMRDLITILTKLARERGRFLGGRVPREDGAAQEWAITPELQDGTRGTSYYFTHAEFLQVRAAIRLAGGRFV